VAKVRLWTDASCAEQTAEQMAEVVTEDGVDDGIGRRVGVRERQDCDEKLAPSDDVYRCPRIDAVPCLGLTWACATFWHLSIFADFDGIITWGHRRNHG